MTAPAEEAPRARAVAPLQRREPSAVGSGAPPTTGEPRAPRRSEPTPLPFDAVLSVILHGSDRRLAIVDGRIVQLGDEVKDARVVDITSTTVSLRDAQGRLRRLTLGTQGR
jgi:hypothetical protein